MKTQNIVYYCLLSGPPTITVSYPGIQNQVHSQIYPNLNSVSLPLPAHALTLSTSITGGRWRVSGGTYFSDQLLVLSDLNEGYNETYQYYVINWEGTEVIAIQILITTTGKLMFNHSTNSSVIVL